jgi:hypothetical protein
MPSSKNNYNISQTSRIIKFLNNNVNNNVKNNNNKNSIDKCSKYRNIIEEYYKTDRLITIKKKCNILSSNRISVEISEHLDKKSIKAYITKGLSDLHNYKLELSSTEKINIDNINYSLGDNLIILTLSDEIVDKLKSRLHEITLVGNLYSRNNFFMEYIIINKGDDFSY